MRTVTKAALLIVSLAAIGTAGYFLIRKSDKSLREGILLKVNTADLPRWTAIVSQMTRPELLDTYQVMQLEENTKPAVVAALGPAFKARVIAIGNKYNIFT